MDEYPSKVTNTDEAGDRHLAIADSVSIIEVSPIDSEGGSTADRGRFEIRDEDVLVWSIAYCPDTRTREEARRMADRIAGAYSLGKRSRESDDR